MDDSRRQLAVVIEHTITHETVVGAFSLDGIVRLFISKGSDAEPTPVMLTQKGLANVQSVLLRVRGETQCEDDAYSIEALLDAIVDSILDAAYAIWAGVGSDDPVVLATHIADSALNHNLDQEWIIALGVSGCDLEQELRIRDVEFLPAKLDWRQRMIEKTAQTISRSVLETNPPAKSGLVTRSHCVGIVGVRAGSLRVAIIKAETHVQTTLGFLWVLSDKLFEASIGIRELGDRWIDDQYLAMNLTESFIQTNMTKPLPQEGFRRMNPLFLPMDETERIEMSLELRSGRGSDLPFEIDDTERRISRAAFWFGRAVQAQDRRERLLCSIIGMESLLLRRHERKKSESLATKVAALVLENSVEPQSTGDKVQALYRLRNSIAHQGELDISRSDADFMLRILRDAIRKSM